jgi:hypothetical protein
MNPELDFDGAYTFYYDETNNIRKFHVKEDDFNAAFRANFVLGGVLYKEAKPDISDLFPALKLQDNVKEMKFKHRASGDLLDCLKSARLNYFFKYLLDSPLYIHYSSLNLLYYSVVDIVDSAIVNSEISKKLGLQFAQRLKNDLYKLCKHEIEEVINLFYHFKYPNISEDNVVPFIRNLTALFKEYINDPEFHFGLESLRQILKESEKKNSLLFIMDETDHVLLREFSQFYLRSIYMFRNSTHIIDNELSIDETLKELNATYEGRPIENFRFEDSMNDPLIQISDGIVGFTGKLFTFINSNSHTQIEVLIAGLTQKQLQTLDTYLDLILKSQKKNFAFFHNVDAYEELSKFNLIFEIRNKQ